MKTLPTLLEESPRPHKKRLKVFYDYIHRFRCVLFYRWRDSSDDVISTEFIGRSVDRLIGLVLLLEHCKRFGYFDFGLDSLKESTVVEIQQSIVDSISCPVLRKVFETDNTERIPIPSSVLDTKFDKKIRDSLWLLFRDNPIPLWLFGDYHQLCVANPHGTRGERQRSSLVRYARGIHYTPAPIVDYLTATVLGERISPDSEYPGVLDPSCGCGSFLIAAFRYLAARYVGDDASSCREGNVLEILRWSLFGVDVDSEAVDWTIRLLYLEARRLIGTGEIDSLSVPDISSNFRVASFFDVSCETFEDRVDTILGGPPFVRYAALRKSQPELIASLRERFTSIKTGQFDLYMPFIEHAVNLIDDGGRIGFSLSNTFLHTDTGKGICRFIADRCTPLEVLEFSGGSIYPDAFVQIALLRLAVGKQEQTRGRHVLIEPTTDIRGPLEQLFSEEPLPSEAGQILPLPENELIPAKPTMPTCADSVRFGDLPVEFLSGATSKSDEIFMLVDQGVGQGVRHGLIRRSKERVQCEKTLAVTIIRGREIKGFRYSSAKYFCLVPYVDGKLIDRESLETDYPLTFRHLERFRGKLDAKGSEPWYAYYSMPIHRSGEVIVSCRIVSPRSFARMELSETTIHGSAFGIAINDVKVDSSLLLLYLNSKHFWSQIDATMPPMGVGRRAIRISILKDLMIPRPIAFPVGQHVAEARILEKKIVQGVWKRNPGMVDALFEDLDAFIEKIVL